MIKKNPANTKQQLLRKNSEQSVQQYPPFEMQDNFSAVDFQDKDRSYYCLENQQVSNPYFIEMTEKQPEQKLKIENGQKYLPEKIAMNGNFYQKIDNGCSNQIVDQIKAICGACQTVQLIPKNSNKFYCYCCRVLCKCGEVKTQQRKKSPQTRSASPAKQTSPKTKLFICGSCKVKVRYQPGISQYIRCSKCNTVNMVSK